MSDKYKQPKRTRHQIQVRVALCLLLVVLNSSLVTVVAKQPAFFEPKEHFYKAKGSGVTVKWDVSNTTVEDEHDLTATLVIARVTNPTEVVKPDLKKLPTFVDKFIITDAADAPRKPNDKEVRFAYKLRPRTRNIVQIPAMEFYYLNPAGAPGKSQYRLTRADAVSITVTDPPKPVPKPIVPMVEADHLFHVSAGPDVLNGPFVPCRWAWLAAGLFGPLAAVGWLLVWRRVYPDAARAAHLRRSRAARRATDAVRKSGRTPDPPATISAAVLAYLRTRFPLPESAVTPSEIAVALAEAQVPTDLAEVTADVFRACDRARFAPPNDSGASLAADAEAAIARLEALA